MMKKLIFVMMTALMACMLASAVGCSPTGVGAVSSSGTSSPASGSSASVTQYDVPVTLSGGSGRASVQSPATVTVGADGSMTLELVWSSSNYDKMVVDGVEYAPVNTKGNSTFQIPVATLDEDLDVQAETTAMSQPHLIDYVLHFDADENLADSTGPTTTQVGNFHNVDLGNGWQPVDSMKLSYATCFTVDYFDGGYKLFCLSDGGRYLTVPEGAQTPEGINDDIVVIQQPLSDVYLVASDTMCLFDALNALDCITVSGISKDNWYVPAAVEAMESGAMAYGGKYNTPDYELLLSEGVHLAIESTMINHTPAVREKLIELGIPVFTEMSSYEAEPLGRTEWVKCYGAMLDKEDEAQALFDEQVAQVASIGSADSGKTVAFFYINSNGAAIVRKPGDYVSKMIKQAGGTYIFDSLDEGEASSSSVTLEMERFYALAKDADVIIYNAAIDGSVDDVDALVRKNALMADFKAVQDGQVWTTSQNMYQQMMQTGQIIADFNAAITDSDAQTKYVYKLS